MLVPWSTIDRMFDRRLDPFGRAFDGFFPVFKTAATATTMNSGLEETDDAFIFTAELPGLTSEQVDVKFEDGVLSIVGERAFEPPEGYTATRRERRFERFEKRFRFRTPVAPAEARAEFSDGVLTVVLPKAAEAKAHTIEVK